MNRLLVFEATICLGVGLCISGCGRSVRAQESAEALTTGAPPPADVQTEIDYNNLQVVHPDQFPSTTAGEYVATAELNVTGVVNADVSRQVPVPSLANGKIAEIDARLGDQVTKGQLLFKVRSPDVANPFSNYRQALKNEELAVDNERLTKIQLDRARLLFDKGAIPKSGLEIAENAEVGTVTALADTKIVTETAKEQLDLMGLDAAHPTGTVSVFSPVAGTITDQEITEQSGVTSLSLPAPFTISDLSHVWIICDVYENDMGQVHLNEYADIHLNAYPDRVLKGKISNILPIMDPNIRTAKVRLEVENPGLMRLGMFVTATFHGEAAQRHATVPTTAILHLHDREWVYSPIADGHFQRHEVMSGITLPGGMQEVVSGIKPGDQVVTNALMLQDTSEK